jgi:putative spermidine/putrescine transport system ATP-binding protein
LRTIQRDVGITFVFVTHDQGEALSMSTRVAVFNRGAIEQVGTPREIYDRPTTAFVAGFVGTSNVLPEQLAARLLGVAAEHNVRPERIRFVDAPDGPDAGAVTVEGVLAEVQYQGSVTRARVRVDDGATLVLDVPSEMTSSRAVGDRVHVGFARAAATRVVIDQQGEEQ